MPEILPIILYVLGSILLVVLIILCIKLILTMNKIESVVDNITVKVNGILLSSITYNPNSYYKILELKSGFYYFENFSKYFPTYIQIPANVV